MHPTGIRRHGRCEQLQLWIAVLGVLLLQMIYLRLHLQSYEACYVSVQGEGRIELKWHMMVQIGYTYQKRKVPTPLFNYTTHISYTCGH